MAATLTPDGELTYFSFPIEKTEETADGDLIVYGKATDGTVDSDLQIVDQDWSAKAIHEWLETGGNLRVQHQARRDPAGKGLSVEATPDGHWVKALVVEPVAKDLVKKGVLTCYSVGITHPDIVPDPSGKAMNGIIRGRRDGLTKISEISLVDRGSNFNSQFQLVKAAGDGAPEFVGKMLGSWLDELEPTQAEPRRESYPVGGAALTDQVTVQRGRQFEGDEDDGRVTLTASPATLAKMLTGHEGVAKRKMDPNVGGGTDRDKIPSADFAGRDRSFPIVTPGDVSDAASSIGRAGSDNYSSDQLKKNIIRIARRKGASFVAELPEAWKKELGMSDAKKAADAEPAKDEDEDTEEKTVTVEPEVTDEAAKSEEPDAAKAGSTGGGSGTSGGSAGGGAAGSGAAGGGKSDGDGDEDDAEKCDDGEEKAAAPTVEKVVAVEKKDKVVCKGCGANVHTEHNFCPECGGELKGSLAIKKNHDFTCLGCGKQLDKGEKFCPNCGKAHPGYLPEADSKVKAAGDEDVDKATRKAEKKARKAAAQADVVKKPTPTDGVEETEDADPVPEHREPDGPAIEALEHDAKVPTVPDSSVKAADLIFPDDPEGSAAMRLKTLNVPVDYGTLHDLTCPCFHPDDVAKSYPRYDLSSLDPNHWQRKAFELAASAPLDQALKANELWQHVVLLKNTDPRYLLEARSELYKEFRDANPGPGTFPTPGSINGRGYNRPIVTAGHAAPSPGHGAPNTAPDPFGSISASQFGRGHLTGGHAAQAPSSAGEPMRPVSAPSVTGVPTRTYYTNAMRDNARQAMLAMHDHIAQTFPDLCPAAPDGSPYGDSLPGSRPVPVGVGGPTPHSGSATKAAKKSKKDKHVVGIENPTIVEPIPVETSVVEKTAEVTKAATLDMDAIQEIVTKAVDAATVSHAVEIAELRKDLKKARKKLDAMAAEPDPVGPYRGVAFDQLTKSMAAPEVLPSVSRAERAQEFVFQQLHQQWRNDPDPMQREVAWRELMKMNKIK